MQGAAPHPFLLKELLPPIGLGDVPLPVCLLHRWVSEGVVPSRTRKWKRALLLAAYLWHLSSALLADLGESPKLPEPRRTRWAIEPSITRVPACTLYWTGASIRPLPATRQLLNDVSESFIRNLLAWAPPVVIPADRDGNHHVVGNQLIAMLARSRIPQFRVPVRRCAAATGIRRPLSEVAQGLAVVLRALVEENRDQVALMAEGAQLACRLSGYSRATYFRLKADRHG